MRTETMYVKEAMKTKLEFAKKTYDYLELISEGYRCGDFSSVFPYLAQDCVMESQWVLTPNEGYEAVAAYLNGKGESLKKSGFFPSCSIVELVGNINTMKNVDMKVNGEEQHGAVGLWYPAGELCLLMKQKMDAKENAVILRLKLSENEKIARIDLCMPELFRYRPYYTFVDFVPCKNNVDMNDAIIRVSEDYYCELYLFLGMAEVDFDEYDDINIPIDNWIRCLNFWKRFFTFKTFSEAYEDACGIDYATFTVKNKEAMRRLSYNGDIIWNNRVNSEEMVINLIEWTEKYKDMCDSISSYGF